MKKVSKFQVPLDLSDNSTEATKYDYFIHTFDCRTPEQYCSMREKVEGLAQKLGFSTQTEDKLDNDFKDRCAKQVTGLYSAVLDGFSLQICKERLNCKALHGKEPYKKFREAINVVSKTVFWDWTKAYTMQKGTYRREGSRCFLTHQWILH